MALPDEVPDRKEFVFKAIYLLKDEKLVWGIDQPDGSFCLEALLSPVSSIADTLVGSGNCSMTTTLPGR
jgi:hypothetical protein